MDWLDKALRLTEREREAVLAAHTARPRPTGPAAVHCDECGCPIPEARRQLSPGTRCCTPCQEDRDKQGRAPRGM